jgi:hypothetical protein
VSDDSFLIMLLETSANRPDQESLHRPRRMYLLASAGGALIDSIGVFPGVEQLQYRDANASHTAIPSFAADTRVVRSFATSRWTRSVTCG